MEGRKFDTDKPRMSLVPSEALWAVIEVLEFGAAKYGEDNWKTLSDADRRYYDAAHRHLQAWWIGQSTDDDSGHSHIAHAICSLLFILQQELDYENRKAG